jgi:G3E family GTPase
VSQIQSQLHPDYLLIETTGIAYPLEMRDNLKKALSIDAKIIVIVDAARWQRLRIPMSHLLNAQIIGSDMVLLNKADLVTPETLEDISKDIYSIEKNATIVPVSALAPMDTRTLESLRKLQERGT